MALSLQLDWGQGVTIYTSDGEIVVYVNTKGCMLAIQAPRDVRIVRNTLLKSRRTP